MFMEHFLGIYVLFMEYLRGFCGVFPGSFWGLFGGCWSLMRVSLGPFINDFWGWESILVCWMFLELGSVKARFKEIEIHWELMGDSGPSSPQGNSLKYQVRNSQPSVHVRSIV